MGTAASVDATKAVSSASIDELRQCLEGLSAEDKAKLREAMNATTAIADGSTMAGVFSGCDGNSRSCVLQLDAGSKAMVRYSYSMDCSDAGGPNILEVTYVYGRWKQIEHHGNTVALIHIASMKTGSDYGGQEGNIKDWKTEPRKGTLSLGGLRNNGGAVLASGDPTRICPVGRMRKEGAACSIEADADYGCEECAFDLPLPPSDVPGKFANGDDSTCWYLHPEGGFRRDFKYALGVRIDIGSWTQVYGNIIEITIKKTKDCDEIEEKLRTEVVFVNEERLQDTSTHPIFSRKEASIDAWPAIHDF
jgi:hypothetical protein|mmetsp:Transcript_125732/g.199296  ORF Transcript_125732/g.199296 Transcript_125732/m.199296 type:complete len:306 (-) Transcript_125732:65-982(-)